MTLTEQAPVTRCGACGQEDDWPKHQIVVGYNNRDTLDQMFHPHDYGRAGVIEYHFHCPTVWNDLHNVLATTPIIVSDQTGDPADDWTDEQAAEHRLIADRHARIVELAKQGVGGDELRQRIRNLDVRGGAGGIDQTMVNGILNALSPNSGTKTIGTVTVTGPIKMRLMTAQGSDTAAGTELATSGGYTAGGASVSMGTAAAGSVASNGAVSWTNMPASTLTGMEQWDSSATPLRSFWGPWTGGNITVGAGNTFTVASGSLTDAIA